MTASTYKFRAVQPLTLPSGNDRVHVPAGGEFSITVDNDGLVRFVASLAAGVATMIDDTVPKPADPAPVVRRIGFY